jgi:hypothetical protein
MPYPSAAIQTPFIATASPTTATGQAVRIAAPAFATMSSLPFQSPRILALMMLRERDGEPHLENALSARSEKEKPIQAVSEADDPKNSYRQRERDDNARSASFTHDIPSRSRAMQPRDSADHRPLGRSGTTFRAAAHAALLSKVAA